MKTRFAFLLLFSLTWTAFGRGLLPINYQDLFDKADLIGIFQPVSVRDTSEKTILPNINPPIPVIGVETEFSLHTLIKGKATNDQRIVLHHYRKVNPAIQYRSGPGLVSFDTEKQEPYLLFLKKEPDGRFAPAYNQTDPSFFGTIRSGPVDFIVLAKPTSSKVQIDSAILPNVRPPVHLIGFETEFGVDRVFKGDPSIRRFTFHHYEREKPDPKIPQSIQINFQPNRDISYLLFLRKEAEGRFAPIGQPTSSLDFPIIEFRPRQ